MICMAAKIHTTKEPENINPEQQQQHKKQQAEKGHEAEKGREHMLSDEEADSLEDEIDQEIEEGEITSRKKAA